MLFIVHNINGLFSPVLVSIMQFVLAHPALKARALDLIFKFPALEDWIYHFALTKGLVAPGLTIQICSDISLSTPKAQLIYADLKDAIEQKGGQ